ncbi:BON domain-containing protein [Nocardia veterana]|uniref:BON domain-containing protein n=1 Tax=Nocardia veterana TaxID=132249 RepID=A0A7X6RIP5_9NOCA|nr:BON domain-containing protein [Nocardia veterana]NKY87397.1 BON domain-containing protein [Nocardia veterana]
MTASIEQLLQTLTRVVNALLAEEVAFAVGGGCAVYARGGPATDHDVDIYIKPADADRAKEILIRAGLRAGHPPEDWLTKVYDGDTLVDLIFRPNYRNVDDDLLGRASWMRIGPAAAPVLSGTDLMVDKLMVLDPHRLDFTRLLAIARDLREQVDWRRTRMETAVSPYARAFLALVEDLGIGHGGDDMTHDPDAEVLPQYLVANLRRAFAEDPRTAELGVQVTIRGGVVVLCGEVGSAQQRSDLEDIVRERVPKLRIHNDIRVATAQAPTVDHERLS